MVSFEIFVKAMPPSLSELKVLPSFCFPIKIRDDRAVTSGYTPPLLKTKTATVTYVNLQDRKERIQIPDVVVSWLLVELRRTYADRRKYRSRRSSRVRFKASRRSDLICSSTAFD